MNYNQFSAEDFATDDYFKQWICSPSPETETFWQNFLSEYPERYYQIEEARRLVIGLYKIQQSPETESVEAIWCRIQVTLNQTRSRSAAWQLNWRPAWAYAAVLFLVIGAGWLKYFWFDQPISRLSRQDPQPAGWIETRNEASELLLVQLPDGSRVKLQRGSYLRFHKDMSGPLREVTLLGEAFFVVKKNPHRPFIVYANGLITKVLGTSFRIKALRNSPTVTVTVHTGRVSVYPHQTDQLRDPELKGMVLTPNQKVVFQRDVVVLNKSLADSPQLVLPLKERESFVFEDASASSVFSRIEKAYGVDLIYDEDTMQHCTLTLDLSQEDLFQKLGVICKVLDATYKVVESQIVIYSKGCQKQSVHS